MIARQIRVRDISGIIIIDFIDMKDECHREEVVAVLKEAVKQDRTQTVVVGMTGLGLVEMTRKKIRQPLASYMTIDCRCCGGSGRHLSPGIVAGSGKENHGLYFAEPGHFLEILVHPIHRVLSGHEKNLERIVEI